MKINAPNMQDVQTGFEPLPAGDYQLKIVECELKTSEKSGNDYLAWKFEVAEGDLLGRAIWDNTSLLPQALWKLKGLLVAAGVPFDEGEDGGFNSEDALGEIVTARVIVEEGQSGPRNSIKAYLPSDN